MTPFLQKSHYLNFYLLGFQVEPVNSPTVEAMINTLVASTQHYMQYLTQEYAYYPLRRGPAICSMTKQEHLDYFTCIEQYEDDL